MAADDVDDPTESWAFGPTPNGGTKSVVYYRDAQGNPAPKSKAVAGEGHELDAAGNSIARVYFTLTPRG